MFIFGRSFLLFQTQPLNLNFQFSRVFPAIPHPKSSCSFTISHTNTLQSINPIIHNFKVFSVVMFKEANYVIYVLV
ncbi:unnamed protein product [Lathyrus sativus]|nr:unnamed protein product [Lathyrus sativus]